MKYVNYPMKNCVSWLIIIKEQNRMSAGQTDVPYIRKFNKISNKESLLKKQGESVITSNLYGATEQNCGVAPASPT
jgi:hypothetical protein